MENPITIIHINGVIILERNKIVIVTNNSPLAKKMNWLVKKAVLLFLMIIINAIIISTAIAIGISVSASNFGVLVKPKLSHSSTAKLSLISRNTVSAT